MNFWPFPLLRNYSTSSEVGDLFEAFLADPAFEVVDRSEFETTVRCSLGVLTFWTANKFYAYAQSGEAKSLSGKRFHWKGCMPSRVTVKRMHKRVRATAFAQWKQA